MTHDSLWRHVIACTLGLGLPFSVALAQVTPYPCQCPPVSYPYGSYPYGYGAYQQGAQAVTDQRAAQLENQRREQEVLALQLENQHAFAELRDEADRQQASAPGQSPAAAIQALTPEQKRFQEAIMYRRFKWPDFDRVAFAQGVQVTADMLGFMAESRYAADIAYYLGKHQERSAQIAKLSPREQAAAISDIEAKLSASSH
jgi:hypothetical protein